MNRRLLLIFVCLTGAFAEKGQPAPADNRPLLHVVDPSSLLFAISGPDGARYVLETSSNLVHWLPAETNVLYGFGLDQANYFVPETFAGGPFYRARHFSYPIINDVPHADDCLPLGPPDDPAVRNAAIPASDATPRAVRLQFHIIAPDDGSDPAPSLDTVPAQVVGLNRQFSSTRIQFVHQARVIRSTRHARPQSDADLLELRRAYSVSPETQLNVFVTTVPGGEHGRSTYPWTTNASGQPIARTADGGIVIARFNIGENVAVLAHEIGHAFGLWHTTHGVDIAELPPCHACWERSDYAGTVDADRSGDRCSDTPAGPLDSQGSPIGGTDPCSMRPWPVSGLRNPMSNQPHIGDRFTPQQAGRMHAWINHTLTGWIDPSTPTLPFGLVATPTRFGEVLLNWTDHSWNETAFAIERAVGTGAFTEIATVPANTTAFTDLTAPSSADARYRVRALNGGTPSAYSNIATATTSPAPADFLVDFRNTTPPYNGTEADPFQNLAQAFAVLPASAARKITIQSGTYSVTFPANPPPTRLAPRAGTVVFQKP